MSMANSRCTHIRLNISLAWSRSVKIAATLPRSAPVIQGRRTNPVRLGDLAQGLVASQVSVAIVVCLEMIYIEQQDGYARHPRWPAAKGA